MVSASFLGLMIDSGISMPRTGTIVSNPSERDTGHVVPLIVSISYLDPLTGPFESGMPRLATLSRDVTCVAYSPDSRHIISGYYDGTIRTWDAETGAAAGSPAF